LNPCTPWLLPFLLTPITYRQSNASGAAGVSDSYFYTFDDHRNFSNTIRISEHFLQSCIIQFNIEIFSFFSISRPGLVGEWSAGLAINDDFFSHGVSSLIISLHDDHYSNFRIQGVKVEGLKEQSNHLCGYFSYRKLDGRNILVAS